MSTNQEPPWPTRDRVGTGGGSHRPSTWEKRPPPAMVCVRRDVPNKVEGNARTTPGEGLSTKGPPREVMTS